MSNEWAEWRELLPVAVGGKMWWKIAFWSVVSFLLVMLPAWANSGCTTLPATRARYCWNDHGSTTVWPNGQVDWERHSRVRVPSARYGRVTQRHRRRRTTYRVIEHESIRYEYELRKDVR